MQKLVDLFPSDGTQWNDTDGDGHGDNKYGTEGDWFPNDPDRWADTDRDGVADEDDAFVNDATQSSDRDGDLWGDDPLGNRADEFPDDPLNGKTPMVMGLGITQMHSHLTLLRLRIETVMVTVITH